MYQKICLALCLLLCYSAQAKELNNVASSFPTICLSNPDEVYTSLKNSNLTYEEEHAQYALAKLSAETTIFQMSVYVFAIEMSHTVKYIMKDIVTQLEALAVDEEGLALLQADIAAKGDSINENVAVTMSTAEDVKNATQKTSVDVVQNKDMLSVDLVLLEGTLSTNDVAYSLGKNNVELSIQIIKLQINGLIAGMTGPEVDEINTLVAEAELVMTTEQGKVDAAKAVMDVASAAAIEAVEMVINPPVPV